MGLLGIILIILLGFLLYSYRPIGLKKETEFREVLRPLAYGRILSVGQSLLNIGFVFFQSFPSFLYDPLFPFCTLPMSPIATGVFVVGLLFMPLLFGWLIQNKLVKPLLREEVPSRNVFRLLSATGLLLLTYIGASYVYLTGASALFLFLVSVGMFTCSVFLVTLAERRISTQNYRSFTLVYRAESIKPSRLDSGWPKISRAKRIILIVSFSLVVFSSFIMYSSAKAHDWGTFPMFERVKIVYTAADPSSKEIFCKLCNTGNARAFLDKVQVNGTEVNIQESMPITLEPFLDYKTILIKYDGSWEGSVLLSWHSPSGMDYKFLIDFNAVSKNPVNGAYPKTYELLQVFLDRNLWKISAVLCLVSSVALSAVVIVILKSQKYAINPLSN